MKKSHIIPLSISVNLQHPASNVANHVLYKVIRMGSKYKELCLRLCYMTPLIDIDY